MDQPEAKPFRFTLRTLLVLLAIAAVPIGFVANRIHEQRKLLSALSGLNVQISYADEHTFHFRFREWGSDNPSTRWPGLSRIDTIVIDDNRATDATMGAIAQVSSLVALDVTSDGVTDNGISHLAALPNLECLALVSSSITDDGLRHLSSLPRLKKLYIVAPNITDAGIARIALVRQLESLHVESKNVTDAGLGHLVQLTRLRRLSLWGTSITDSGLRVVKHMYLTGLSIANTPVTEACLEHVRGLSDLELFNTQVTVSQIHSSKLPLPRTFVDPSVPPCPLMP